MGDILSLAKKLERAMRNDTGFSVTREEMAALIDDEIVDAVNAAKLRKLKECRARNLSMSSEAIGSRNDATASPPTSGKSRAIPKNLDRTFIEALGLGT